MALLARASGSIFYINNCYFSTLILNCWNKKLFIKYSFKLLTLNKQLSTVRFQHSGALQTTKNVKYFSYNELMKERRLQALRSVVIEVLSQESGYELYSHCSKFGKINEMFHYTTSKGKRHFILIEFSSIDEVETILKASTHIDSLKSLPVQSTLLWFRAAVSNTTNIPTTFTDIQFSDNCTRTIPEVEVYNRIIKTNSISDQIRLFHKMTKLSDVSVRLRFYTAYQIERSLSGFFPNITILPFGSSVNGFGKQNCDLDLTVILEKSIMENKESRLVFQSQFFTSDKKQRIRKLMEIVADTMYVLMPGIRNIRKILEARVPIIRFDHALTGVECDLSVTNNSANYMSELLFIFGEIDWRVRPLIFAVKKWAESARLIDKKHPGPNISNFSLSLMVIFFLQRKKILPSFNLLKANATEDDVQFIDNYVDCTFQRNLTKISKVFKIQCEDSLESLLLGFFTYFSNFDYERRAISVKDGKVLTKPDSSPLYITNPLETSLNVSKNVNYEQSQRIRSAMRSACWHMENQSHNKSTNEWGILGLFNDMDSVTYSMFKSKNIDCKQLLQDEKLLNSGEAKKIEKTKRNYTTSAIL